MKLLFASSNENKATEIQAQIGHLYTIVTLKDYNYYDDLPETGDTLSENAIQKAQEAYALFSVDCFSEDTGLEVEALNNAPGVYSARYAGNQKNASDNMNKLLKALESESNRNARFRTCIALITKGDMRLFEGEIRGKIALEKKGDSGFGYDPVFIPDGYSQTFAELPLEVKKQISHRAVAINKLIQYLNSR